MIISLFIVWLWLLYYWARRFSFWKKSWLIVFYSGATQFLFLLFSNCSHNSLVNVLSSWSLTFNGIYIRAISHFLRLNQTSCMIFYHTFIHNISWYFAQSDGRIYNLRCLYTLLIIWLLLQWYRGFLIIIIRFIMVYRLIITLLSL